MAAAEPIRDREELERVLRAGGVEVESVEVALAGPPALFAARVARAHTDRARAEELVPRTGRWPVIAGEGVRSMVEQQPPRPHEDLREAAALDVERWFRELPDEILEEPDDVPDMGEWEPDAADADFEVEAVTGVPDGPATILLPETPRSYEVPAYLGFGGWNAYPDPHEHVAVLRRWHERYGVELFLVETDVLALAVGRLPETEEEARALAWEYFLYDEDSVYQGAETLGALASLLANARFWHFWWD